MTTGTPPATGPVWSRRRTSRTKASRVAASGGGCVGANSACTKNWRVTSAVTCARSSGAASGSMRVADSGSDSGAASVSVAGSKGRGPAGKARRPKSRLVRLEQPVAPAAKGRTARRSRAARRFMSTKYNEHPAPRSFYLQNAPAVLDCGGPPPLVGAPDDLHAPGKSTTGLAQSKTSRAATPL